MSELAEFFCKHKNVFIASAISIGLIVIGAKAVNSLIVYGNNNLITDSGNQNVSQR